MRNFSSTGKKHCSFIQREMYVDVLNCLGVDHECDRQIDGQTEKQIELPLSIVRSKIVRRMPIIVTSLMQTHGIHRQQLCLWALLPDLNKSIYLLAQPSGF